MTDADRRPGTRHVATLPPGASWILWRGKIIVAAPDAPPRILEP